MCSTRITLFRIVGDPTAWYLFLKFSNVKYKNSSSVSPVVTHVQADSQTDRQYYFIGPYAKERTGPKEVLDKKLFWSQEISCTCLWTLLAVSFVLQLLDSPGFTLIWCCLCIKTQRDLSTPFGCFACIQDAKTWAQEKEQVVSFYLTNEVTLLSVPKCCKCTVV